MIELINEPVICIQLNKLSLEFMIDHMFISRKREPVIVFDGSQFYTVIEGRELSDIMTEEEFLYFLYYECNREWTSDIDEAKEIFDKNSKARFILADIPYFNMCSANFYRVNNYFDEEEYRNTYNEIYNELKKYDVNTFLVNIPRIDEVINSDAHKDIAPLLDYKWFWYEHMEHGAKHYLKKCTDMTYEEALAALKENMNVEAQLGSGDRKIFLVGPCIVNGWGNFNGEELAVLLNEVLVKSGFHYEINNIVINRTSTVVVKSILEKNICKNDIVIFIDQVFGNVGLNLKPIFDQEEDYFFYMDEPIHTTKKGNELIVHELIEKIIRPIYDKSCVEDDKRVIFYGEPQFTYQSEQEIMEYIKKVPKLSGIKGAVVMNCNPFTLGHRYLIEEASKQVSSLYIFVVEEDRSDVPFKNRYRLVAEGIKDIENVCVIPSGKYIISKETFKNYFDKDICQQEIDVSTDVYIFARYIARELGIVKRFVGEEPFDRVTNEYNKKMKEVLPKYNIELVEIPRKNIQGEVISATKVRKYLIDREWDKMQRMLPKESFYFMRSNADKLERQMKQRKRQSEAVKDNGIQYQLEQIDNFIKINEHIVLYGVGNNAERILEYIGKAGFEKLVLVDKSAQKENIFFKGKKVYSPDELYAQYSDYYILIATNKYGREIFTELLNHGINAEKIFANVCQL